MKACIVSRVFVAVGTECNVNPILFSIVRGKDGGGGIDSSNLAISLGMKYFF